MTVVKKKAKAAVKVPTKAKVAAAALSKLSVFDQDGKKLSETELSPTITTDKVNKPLLVAAVRMYQTNQRTGTSKVKSRHFVSGSTRKIYKQKGTGQARHGDIKAPLFVGGGVTFGPRPRDWSYHLPKTALRQALLSAITYVRKNGKVCVLDKLDWAEAKTRQGAALVKKLGLSTPLFILDQPTEPVMRSLRNLASVGIRGADSVNAFDILKHNELVITLGSLVKLEKRLGAGGCQ